MYGQNTFKMKKHTVLLFYIQLKDMVDRSIDKVNCYYFDEEGLHVKESKVCMYVWSHI